VAQVDVLVVSAANTTGWRAASEGLAGSIERAGATVELAAAPPSRRVRTFALTDLVEARDARRAAREGIARHQPRAVVYCSGPESARSSSTRSRPRTARAATASGSAASSVGGWPRHRSCWR
jgi:hypothetical protein